MNNRVAQAMMELTVGQRAELKCGKVPTKHMAAIVANGTELTSGQTRPALAGRIAQLETALNAAGGSVPNATGNTRRDMVARIGQLESALTKRGAVVPAFAPVKARQAKTTTTTTTTAAKVPIMTHTAAVHKTAVESIQQAREAEAQAKRDKELVDARNLGAKVIENEKRKAAFAPVAAAMDAAAVRPEPVAKVETKRKQESDYDRRARAAYRKYNAMPAGPERTAFYKANKALIQRGGELENGNK